MVNFRYERRKVLAYVGSWHFSDIPPALTNFRFWGQSGRCADACRSPLMTQSGHVRSGNVRQRAGRTACQSGVRTGTTASAVMAPRSRHSGGKGGRKNNTHFRRPPERLTRNAHQCWAVTKRAL